MEKPKVLVAHHPKMMLGMAEIQETDEVFEEGKITMTDAMTLVFITECLAEDLFALGVIRMINARGKQALVIKNPEQEIPGLL